MKKLDLIILLLIFSATIVVGQKPKFKKVTKEELQKTACSYDETANAEYLYHGCKVVYKYNTTSGGFDVKYYYHDRIKIYNEDGMDVADQVLRFYTARTGSDSEYISELEAYTYNLKDGEVVKEKLNKKNIFKEKESEYYSALKFAMPAVESGSVLEIKYILTSPYYFQMDEFYFQKNYPVKYTEYEIGIPEYFNYNQNVKGLVGLDVQESKGQGYFNYTVGQRRHENGGMTNPMRETFRYVENIKTYSAMNIPTLKSEPFVYTMNNFKSSIKLELLFTKYPNSEIKYYTKSWDDIAGLLYKHDSFGKQLKKNYKEMDDLLGQVKDMDDQGKMKTIFNAVKNQFTWNSQYSKYTDKGIKNLLKEGTGNSAEINLLLVNLLKKAGLQAYPMVYKTRYSGNLNITNPSIAELDYVVAIVATETTITYLDATNKNLEIDMLPSRALNLKGVVLIDDKGQDLPIENHNKGNESKVYTLKIAGDDLEGTYKQKVKGYDAFHYRSKYSASDEMIAGLQNDKIDLVNSEIKDFDDCNKPISIESEIVLKGHTQSFDGKIFIDLMVGEEDFKNPFESEEREFALFFDSKSSLTKMIKIEIPEGYQVESLPEAMNIATPEKHIIYMLKPQVVGNEIVVTIRNSINQTIISPEYYEAVRMLYDNVERISNEKIVLAKI